MDDIDARSPSESTPARSSASDEFRPRVVCVTGATGGFGTAIAIRFAKLGARLILIGRREARLRELARELHVPSHTAVLDVRDREGVARTFADLPEPFRAVDVLVNNAGLALGLEPTQSANLDDWDAMIDTNDKGLVYCTRAALPGMIERNRGHIINMSSIAGSYPYPGGHVYCASKAFVTQFSLAIRADLLGTEVRVTSIEPGLVETDFSLVRFKGDQERARAVYAGTVPLIADDVADAVEWAATRPARVNINRIELMPVVQSFGPLAVKRR